MRYLHLYDPTCPTLIKKAWDTYHATVAITRWRCDDPWDDKARTIPRPDQVEGMRGLWTQPADYQPPAWTNPRFDKADWKTRARAVLESHPQYDTFYRGDEPNIVLLPPRHRDRSSASTSQHTSETNRPRSPSSAGRWLNRAR